MCAGKERQSKEIAPGSLISAYLATFAEPPTIEFLGTGGRFALSMWWFRGYDHEGRMVAEIPLDTRPPQSQRAVFLDHAGVSTRSRLQELGWRMGHTYRRCPTGEYVMKGGGEPRAIRKSQVQKRNLDPRFSPSLAGGGKHDGFSSRIWEAGHPD